MSLDVFPREYVPPAVRQRECCRTADFCCRGRPSDDIDLAGFLSPTSRIRHKRMRNQATRLRQLMRNRGHDRKTMNMQASLCIVAYPARPLPARGKTEQDIFWQAARQATSPSAIPARAAPEFLAIPYMDGLGAEVNFIFSSISYKAANQYTAARPGGKDVRIRPSGAARARRA